MKYKVILILIYFVVVSCSKSVYYEYTSPERYATVELTKKNEFIYRVSDGAFIHIKSNTGFSNEQNATYIGLSQPYWLYTVEQGNAAFDMCGFVHTIPNNEKNELIFKKVGQDSIISIGKTNRKQFLKNGSCFVEKNITWFPPFLTRVKKINYKEFNFLKVKDKYLKDPNKAPKAYE